MFSWLVTELLGVDVGGPVVAFDPEVPVALRVAATEVGAFPLQELEKGQASSPVVLVDGQLAVESGVDRLRCTTCFDARRPVVCGWEVFGGDCLGHFGITLSGRQKSPISWVPFTSTRS